MCDMEEVVFSVFDLCVRAKKPVVKVAKHLAKLAAFSCLMVPLPTYTLVKCLEEVFFEADPIGVKMFFAVIGIVSAFSAIYVGTGIFSEVLNKEIEF